MQIKSIQEEIINICINAKNAGKILSYLSGNDRNYALKCILKELKINKADILNANIQDIKNAELNNLSPQFIKRLTINESVFNYMLQRIEETIALDDPIGRILDGHTGPDGLIIQKISSAVYVDLGQGAVCACL